MAAQAAANNGVTHYVWDIFGNIIAEANGSTGATLRETIYLQDGAPGAMPELRGRDTNCMNRPPAISSMLVPAVPHHGS